MNRAERRREKRKQEKSEKVYQIKKENLAQMKDDVAKKSERRAFIALLGLPLIVLHDKYGFGKKRLSDFMEYLLSQYEAFVEGYITLEDLANTIEEETGVKIWEEPKR